MYRFNDVEIDPACREIRRAGVAVRLEPQAFDLLVLLIEHRDQVVSKIDLLDGGHFVDVLSAVALALSVTLDAARPAAARLGSMSFDDIVESLDTGAATGVQLADLAERSLLAVRPGLAELHPRRVAVCARRPGCRRSSSASAVPSSTTTSSSGGRRVPRWGRTMR